MVESSSDAVDLSTPDGKHFYQNKVFSNLFGEIMDDPVSLYVDKKIAHEIFSSILAGNEWKGEIQMYNKNKEILDISLRSYAIKDEDNKIICLVGLHYDITDRKKIEFAIGESQQRFRSMIEHSAEAITLINKAGDVLYESPSVPVITGYNIQDRIGKSGFETVYPDDLPLIKSLFNKLLSDPDRHQRVQFRCIKSDGSVWWADATATNKLNEPNVKAIIINYHDITELKEAEEKLKEQNTKIQKLNDEYLVINQELSESIERIQKINTQLLEAKEKAQESDRLKTNFLNNISHEIRTPMNAIMGFTDLLLECDNNKEKLEYYNSIIIQRCSDLLTIIDDILDISKIESGNMPVHPSPIDINELFSELNELFVPIAKKLKKTNVQIFFKKTDESNKHQIIADKGKIKQILINLIHNALKFTYTGSIKIDYSIVKENQIAFSVADTGIGIDKEYYHVIFERFKQLDNNSTIKYGGTGLGLSIVKGLAELLGGSIQLESMPGKGSKFDVFIPFQTYTEKVENKKNVEKSNLSSLANKSVLIVEDDIFNIQYLREILTNLFTSVEAVTTGEEAINLIKNGRDFDIILMDIRLPGINGNISTGIIKKLKPNIKVIAQTAYAAASDHQMALESGCDDYISKPIKKELLLEKLILQFS